MKVLRIGLLIVLLTSLAGCASWRGLKNPCLPVSVFDVPGLLACGGPLLPVND